MGDRAGDRGFDWRHQKHHGLSYRNFACLASSLAVACMDPEEVVAAYLPLLCEGPPFCLRARVGPTVDFLIARLVGSGWRQWIWVAAQAGTHPLVLPNLVRWILEVEYMAYF